MMLLQQRRHLDLGQQHGCLEDKAMKREFYAGKTEDREMVKTPVITDEARRMMLVTQRDRPSQQRWKTQPCL